MFGYLDASADTQWVRILPVREELFLEPRPLDFIVTMEHAESGESIVMQDSLFSYFQGYAWNFRSEMDIRPGKPIVLLPATLMAEAATLPFSCLKIFQHPSCIRFPEASPISKTVPVMWPGL